MVAMSIPSVELHAFVYGEHLEGIPLRSLGYRLIVPDQPEPWTAEVERLARDLQAAPYPDAWPPVDLFCSVILADGQRLIALARFGVADHTASRRRGGLELIGVVGPGSLGVRSATAIYQWLRKRRSRTEELRLLGGRPLLAEVLSEPLEYANPAERPPASPVGLWQQGSLVLVALSAHDPEEHLCLLEGGAGQAWQWLPLIGSDFPLQSYAERGSLIAWTAHWAGRTPGLDPKMGARRQRATRRRRVLQSVLALILVSLLVVNLSLTLARRPRAAPTESTVESALAPRPDPSTTISREAFARSLNHYLRQTRATHEWTQQQLVGYYERLARQHENLRVASAEEKSLIGAVAALGNRDLEHLESIVRDALNKKGYDPELINLACRRIRERLEAESRQAP
jgi:hypothetical protein